MTGKAEMARIRARVTARRALTPEIEEFTVAPAAGGELPGYAPGAHITVETPDGAMRRYSLTGLGEDLSAYTFAVKREADSRGGSASMHQRATEGATLMIEPPENDFPLRDGPEHLLIAGGVGVTPLYSMARALDAAGAKLRMIYCARSPEAAAYRDELEALLGDRLALHHDGGEMDAMFDFWDEFETVRDLRVYCCGPAALMEDVKAVTGHWPEGRIAFEDFKPVAKTRAGDRPFTVELRRSAMTVEVPAERTILEAVRDAGAATVSSCESGTCGTCKTGLLQGEPDHRDMVLTEEERGARIMICVSRAKSGDLVLDL